MLCTIRITSEEKDDFSILLQVDTQNTFLDLHKIILDVCSYDATQMASFFTTDREGQVLQEIGLMEMSSDEETAVAVMDVSSLEEFIGKEIKNIEYEYDFFNDRYFKLVVEDIVEGNLEYPKVLELNGTPPEQIALEDFDGLDFSKSDTMDYEKYLQSFDDCKEEDDDDFYEEDENDYY